MATVATRICCDAPAPGLLPAQPRIALHPHYGMLLGVDDFVTEQAYHRGKVRLHNAWAHGAGALWGLGVSADAVRGEIEVGPGLALDGFGRELMQDAPQCVNVAAWFDAHAADAGMQVVEDGDLRRFAAHVTISHDACLARPVPALADGCQEGSGTAYSRIVETVLVELRPGRAPAPPPGRQHLLRVLLGLDEATLGGDGNPLPADQQALDARAEIAAAPPAQRPAVAARALHRLAVADSLAMQSEPDPPPGLQAGLYPAGALAALVLADLPEVTLRKQDQAFAFVGAQIDQTVRPVLLATQALQTLGGALLAALV